MEVYHEFLSLFNTLPIAALVGERRFFCVHGGISPQLKKASFSLFFFTFFLLICILFFNLHSQIEAIQTLDRFKEIPESGVISDMLWADPIPPTADSSASFLPNDARGCSYYYGCVI